MSSVFKIKLGSDLYQLEGFGAERIYPSLNQKNSEIIERAIAADARYSKESKITPPNEKKKYVGSAIHWFDKMKNGGDFGECLRGAVAAIDCSDSTHLSASAERSKRGRDIAYSRIFDRCDTLEKFKAELENTDIGKDHLIGILCKAIGKRHNLSFATKLCAYAAESLDLSVRYPKYDKVVASVLPVYTKYYLTTEEKKKTYLVTGADRKQCNGDEDAHISLRLGKYNSYRTSLEQIQAKLKNDGVSLSLMEMDHIIWYANKRK